MRLEARLAGRWRPAELGVHPAAGGGPLPAYVRRPHDERLRVILAPPVADGRLVVVRGEPGTGTSLAAWEAVADVLAEWPLEYPRTAAVLTARVRAGIPAGTVPYVCSTESSTGAGAPPCPGHYLATVAGDASVVA